mgnify:CR=1 FL=1
MATTNDLKNGLVLNIDGQLWTVVEFQHVKPGKGGAFVRIGPFETAQEANKALATLKAAKLPGAVLTL